MDAGGRPDNGEQFEASHDGARDYPGGENEEPHSSDQTEEKSKKRKRTAEEKEARKLRKKEKKQRKRERAAQRYNEKKNRSEAPDSVSSGRKRYRTRDQSAAADPEDDDAPSNADYGTRRNTNKRSKKREAITEEDAVTHVREFLQRMNAAAEEDEAALASGKPALTKLSLLNEFITEVSMPKWTHWFLREGVCETVAKWLTPFANGSLSNATIRTQLLDLMIKLPVQLGHLQDTNLGPILIVLWRSPDEEEENRSRIRLCIERLLRPFTQMRSTRAEFMEALTRNSAAAAAAGAAGDETGRANIPKLSPHYNKSRLAKMLSRSKTRARR